MTSPTSQYSGPAAIESPKAATSAGSAASGGRLISLDAYRGFIMVVLVANGFGFVETAKRHPGTFWSTLAEQFQHAPWLGCTLWDLIMPAFLFMTGMAMAISYARREARGDSLREQIGHAATRALLLVVIGMLLQQQHNLLTNVLTQMGFGYLVVFFLLRRRFRLQILATAGILVGYWLLFVAYSPPGPSFDYAAAGITQNDVLPGIWAHWSKNVNLGAVIDRWLLNLFPQDVPFQYHPGGIVVITFIPSIANMAFGALSGQMLLRRTSNPAKLRWLVVAAAICLVLALALGATICPMVRRLWTPTYALYTGAWTLGLLAVFYWVVEVLNWRRWTYPFVVVGCNSIAVYLMSILWVRWISHRLRVHLGGDVFNFHLGPIVEHAAILAILWAICWWMYRNRIFLKL